MSYSLKDIRFKQGDVHLHLVGRCRRRMPICVTQQEALAMAKEIVVAGDGGEVSIHGGNEGSA